MSEHETHQHPTSHYVRIWAILVVLLAISIAGPTLGIEWVTLLTAFGVAIVKAYMVAVKFMHINLTPRFVTYMVTTTLVFMFLFFSGAAPDVMEDHGTNWEKPAWIASEAAWEAEEAAGGHHGHNTEETEHTGHAEHH